MEEVMGVAGILDVIEKEIESLSFEINRMIQARDILLSGAFSSQTSPSLFLPYKKISPSKNNHPPKSEKAPERRKAENAFRTSKSHSILDVLNHASEPMRPREILKALQDAGIEIGFSSITGVLSSKFKAGIIGRENGRYFMSGKLKENRVDASPKEEESSVDSEPDLDKTPRAKETFRILVGDKVHSVHDDFIDAMKASEKVCGPMKVVDKRGKVMAKRAKG